MITLSVYAFYHRTPASLSAQHSPMRGYSIYFLSLLINVWPQGLLSSNYTVKTEFVIFLCAFPWHLALQHLSFTNIVLFISTIPNMREQFSQVFRWEVRPNVSINLRQFGVSECLHSIIQCSIDSSANQTPVLHNDVQLLEVCDYLALPANPFLTQHTLYKVCNKWSQSPGTCFPAHLQR